MKKIIIKRSNIFAIIIIIINLIFIFLGLFLQFHKLMFIIVVFSSFFYISFSKNNLELGLLHDKIIIKNKQDYNYLDFFKYYQFSFLLSIIICRSSKKTILIPIFIDSVCLNDYKYLRLKYRFGLE
jgi:hypothetical protein